jgi:hypothetical protein
MAVALYLGVSGLPPHAEAEASQPGNQGLQGGWAIDNAGNVSGFAFPLSSQYAMMQQAGAGWVRINFRLGKCFKNWTAPGCTGGTALAAYDQVVQLAHQRNLQVHGLLSNESWTGGQPQWRAQSAEATGGNGDNGYIRDFASNVAGVLAAHFNGVNGPAVSSWEIWNEPNAFSIPRGWPGKVTGATHMYPSNFSWLLKRCYTAIKAANPSAVVISGGLFSHDATGVVDSGANYLNSTYQAGKTLAGWVAPYPLDGIGQHIYIDQGTPTSAGKLGAVVQEVRNAYLAHEGAGTSKRTHITEIGWTTASVSESTQSTNLRIAYQTLATPAVARSFWFNVQDHSGLAYGLVTTGGVQKPAFQAYQLYAK